MIYFIIDNEDDDYGRQQTQMQNKKLLTVTMIRTMRMRMLFKHSSFRLETIHFYIFGYQLVHLVLV